MDMVMRRKEYWNDKYKSRSWPQDIHFGLWTDTKTSLEDAVAHNTRALVERILEESSLFALAQGAVVLDIGCGTSDLLIKLVQTLEGARGFGIDVSEEAIRLSTERASAEHVRGRLNFTHVNDDWLTAGGLNWFEDIVVKSDIVVIRDSFYLFTEEEQSILLATISEKLRPGGVLVIADWAVHVTCYSLAEQHFVLRQHGGKPIQFEAHADPIGTSSLAKWLHNSQSLVLSSDERGEQVFQDAVFRSYDRACTEYADEAPEAYRHIRDAAVLRNGVSNFPYLVFLMHKSQSPNELQEDRGVVGFRVSEGSLAAKYLPSEFAFESGRWHLVIGRSGVGKTTMLGALSGSNGARPFGSDNGRRPATYYLPQDVSLIPTLTVEQNVLLFARTTDHLSEIWRQLGLTRNFTARLADERLSGGERQRVAIAQAMAAEPDLLLLDEPSRGLDRIRRRQFFHYLKTWLDRRTYDHRPPTTVICVDHNFGDVQEFFDNVFELRRGQLIKVERSAGERVFTEVAPT